MSRSIRERACDVLDRIAAMDHDVNAYVALDRTAVMREAQRLDALAPGERGPLHGVLLAVKDLIDVAGYPTRAGSGFFSRTPAVDAPVVAALRAAGAIVIGKTNTHEFAWGVTTENPHFGRTRNPWDHARIAGGSSGGSAAALAAGLADLALGTDTQGSIRAPAALCGVSGIRPAIGAISIDGIVPLAPGLDTVGPMAVSVREVAAAYAVLAPLAGAPPRCLRIGRLRTGAWDAVDPALVRALDDFTDAVAALPQVAEVRDVEWFEPELAAATATVQQASVAAAGFHAPLFAAHRDEYGTDVRERFAAAFALDPALAAPARALILQARERLAAAAEPFDLLLAPAAPGEAPRSPVAPSFRTELMPLVAPASAFGLPALAVPIGFGVHGLPLGAQLLVPGGDAALAFALGEAYQRVTDWHVRRPAFA